MVQNILIVEDAVELGRLVDDYLVNAGYSTHCLHSGNGVVEWVREHTPDLVLLDLMLPGRDGLDICREIRRFSSIPVIMITARAEEQDRLRGLDIGADDYICKPFSPREVVARVKAVLRRADSSTPQVDGQPPGIILDAGRLEVMIHDRVLSLTVIEFHLLELLVSQPGRVFSRSQLIDRIYPDRRVVGDRTVDSHVKKLRRKIAAVHQGELICSVYSAGYKYVPEEF